VAQTIGRGIVDVTRVNEQVILVVLAGAVFWNMITWSLKIPSSSSHALIGGLLGSVSMRAGAQAVQVQGLLQILVALFASPILGFLIGFILLRLILLFSQRATPRINEFIKRSQIISAVALGLSHGSNDSQKTMGMITLALFSGGYVSSFDVPFWVTVLCATALTLGTLVGGWRLIHTTGASFYKIRAVDGFATQLSSALVIISASLAGGPVSATQVINSAIMGVGAGERANKVRWGIGRDILTAWVITIPVTGFLSAGLYYLAVRFVF
jgi:PiT family inorganic phosphate transporter